MMFSYAGTDLDCVDFFVSFDFKDTGTHCIVFGCSDHGMYFCFVSTVASCKRSKTLMHNA